MNLKPKPFWLRWFTNTGTWVTLAPTIYHPAHMLPQQHPELVAHEVVHIWQQESAGKWRWLWSWFTNRSFRLAVEAEGIAAEVWASPPALRQGLMEAYAADLAGSMYFHAASSVAEAYAAISRAIFCAGPIEGVKPEGPCTTT